MASGSVTNANFRGKAPAAKLFVQPVGMLTEAIYGRGDFDLALRQRFAARRGADQRLYLE